MSVDSELPTAAALADAAANPTTPTVGAANLVFNGTTWDRVRGDTANGLDVDVTRLPALAAGTNNIGDVDILSIVPGTGSTNLGKAEDSPHTTGDVGVMMLGVRQDSPSALAGNGDYIPIMTDGVGRLWTAGQIAHDSPVSGAPVRIGGKANTTAPAAVAAGDQVDGWSDLTGATVVLDKPTTSGGPANVSTSTASATLIASNGLRQGASIWNDASTTLYVKFGATASATSFHVAMSPQSYLEVPFRYTGIVDGILSSGTGTARIGEFT
jgi:hypothetical protein